MRIPKYRRNPDGRAFIERQGKRTYLGAYGTAESKRRYEKLIRPLLDLVDRPDESGSNLTVSHLACRFLEHAEEYYADGSGQPTGEVVNIKYALRPLLLGDVGAIPAEQFGPIHLDRIVDEMIAQGLRRGTINSRLGRIKRCFRWCARKELLPITVYQSLLTVEGLRAGRSPAKESRTISSVAKCDIEALLPFVSSKVGGMVQVQYYCGMRPGEVCIMRRRDIDTSGEIWFYRPETHKNTWRGAVLVKAIPKIAQSVLQPFLTAEFDGYLFRPVSTKKHCYTPNSYRSALCRGFEKASKSGVEIPYWFPNQLRHAIATELRQSQGEQAAQIWLGHENLNTTGIYTEKQITELVAVAHVLDQRWAS